MPGGAGDLFLYTAAPLLGIVLLVYYLNTNFLGTKIIGSKMPAGLAADNMPQTQVQYKD